MDPIVTGSLISAGASILGGAFGGGGSGTTAGRYRDARFSAHQQRAYDQYNYQHYNSIRARAQDARLAGLHPLFALGAGGSGGGGSPSFQMAGQQPKGSSGMEGVATAARQYGRLQAEKDLIDAQNTASALRLAEHKMSNDTSGAIVDSFGLVSAEQARHKTRGRVEVTGDPYINRSKTDSSRSAAVRPMWMQVETGMGFNIDLPWSEEGPAEALSIGALPFIALRNTQNLGRWLDGQLAKGIVYTRSQVRALVRESKRKKRPARAIPTNPKLLSGPRR